METGRVEEARWIENDVSTIAADGVGRVEIIGSRVRVIFFEYQIIGGVLVRMPVICIKRQLPTIPSVAMERWQKASIIVRQDWQGTSNRLM